MIDRHVDKQTDKHTVMRYISAKKSKEVVVRLPSGPQKASIRYCTTFFQIFK